MEIQSGVLPHEPYPTLSLRVAEAVKAELLKNPRSVLGLPTGRTPTGAYRELARWSSDGVLDWSEVTTFGLDEYIDSDESTSFRRYLEVNLYNSTNLRPEKRFNPLFVDNYDRLIQDVGGLDLTILGIGKNGHIAFNEPGTPLDSWTHSIVLTESTRQANAEFFKAEQVPTRATTMGLRTILGSRRIILMVSGQQKKGILERALRGPVTEDVPASFLQLHNNVTVMADFEL